MKIYPTITAVNGNQKEKILEADTLGIKKLCVFFSPLSYEKRKKLFRDLEKSNINEIPFAHIRGDFTREEIILLKEKYKTNFFNIHSANQHPVLPAIKEFAKEIYIENTMTEFSEYEIKNYAGICLDISHYENDRLSKNKRYQYYNSLLGKMNCGCGHISAIKNETDFCPVAEDKRYDRHTFTKLSDFDYLLKHKNILPGIMALEVENPIKEQLEAIKYISELLDI